MLGNSLVGIACGWLFWKHGIVSAIVGHFAIDVVLHDDCSTPKPTFKSSRGRIS
jgi:hypothetical protein